ncbi:MAG: redox-sensing transcriptional repressor Rex [Clostridia bacterium]
MEKKYISQAVIKRMPRYYRYVNEMIDMGINRISSKALAEKMGLTASQIRQDLNCFGGFGQQGYGYNVESLRDELAQILGLNKDKKAIIVGVGNMGRALTKNFHFERSGIELIAGFDLDFGSIDTVNGPIAIFPIDNVDSYIESNDVEIAIITLPKELASTTAERLVRAGIKGIWNFTSSDLHLQGYGIPIENVHFSDSLRTLSYNMEKNNV